jgi:arylsulfatase A-like enzyme
MKVLVITARGLQAAYLGCYGNAWIETPAVDALAARGVVFDQHFADAAGPDGARRAWRHGRYLFPAPGEADPALPASSPDLIAALSARGVATHLIVDASRPAPAAFASGWGTVEHTGTTGGAPPQEQAVEAGRAALRRLARHEAWLLWVDLATPLPPWDVPDDLRERYLAEEPLDEDEEDGEEAVEVEPLTPLPDPAPGPVDPDDDTLYLRLQGSYAAAVTYLDAGIGRLLDALAQADRREDVVVMLTSDGGFLLGEHGVVGPARVWLYHEAVHLPLVVRLPGADEAGRRVEVLTQAVDLAPTLADVFDVPFGPAHGHTLVPLLQGEAEQVRPYAVSGARVGGAIEWALRTPDQSFLLPVERAADDAARMPQLYVRPDDRYEVNNIRQHRLEWTERLEETLRAFVGATRGPGPLTPPPLPEEAEAAEAPAAPAEAPPPAGAGD